MALTSEQQTSHLSRLQQEILPWDYYRIGTSEEEDAVKPAGNRTLREVPQTFTSVDEYVNVFEPLVLEECAAQLGRTDDDEDQRAAVIGAVEKSERVNGFHVVRFALREEAAREFRDNDVFLLSKFDPFEDEEFDDDDEDEEGDEEEGGDGDDAKKKKNKKSETSAKRAAVLADDHPDAAFLTGAAGASNKRAADAFAPDDDREWRRAYALGFVDAKERKERVRVRFFLPDSPNTSRLSARAGETLDDADYARFRSVRNALARGKGAW